MKLRLNTIIILLISLSTIFAGCVPESANADKTIKIAMSAEPDSLDCYLSAATDTEAMMLNIHRGLVFFDTTGAIIPAAAKSWSISEDGLTYSFELRDDVVFHNGKALTAEDVIYSYRKLSGLDGGAANSKFADISSVEATGDYSVDICLNSPDASFLSRCRVPIVPEGYDGQAEKPIGCGPYRFVEYNPTRNLKLERFDDYFDKDNFPKIEKAEFVFFADANSQFLALSTAAVDFSSVSYENAAALPDNLYTIQNVPMNTVQGLFMNLSAAPFDNPDVRRAIWHAIDEESIIAVTTNGEGVSSSTLLSATQTAWHNELSANPYPYDVDKAISLLAQAGYPDGFDMEIIAPSNYKIHVDTAQIIADQLNRAGIRATIKLVEWAQWLEDVYGASKFQATVCGFSGKLDPYEVFIRYQSGYRNNFSKFSNSDYDYLLSRVKLESDEALRLSYVKELQQILVDEAVSVCVQDITYLFAMKKGVTGFAAYPTTFYDLSLFDME